MARPDRATPAARPSIGYCRLCTRQIERDTARCPHCAQQDPVDRFEDLALGEVYEAEYAGTALDDLHWFTLKPSGRRVFAEIPHEDEVRKRFAEICASHGGHRLECHSFEDGYPSFRYLPARD